MPYNPNIHHRRSIRLKGYDYSQAGLYFITICCENREHRFGKIENGEMILNEYGQIAFDEWLKTTKIRNNVELGAFIVMPNHMHGIIVLNHVVGAGFTPAPTKPATIGDIAGAYKSLVTNACIGICNSQNIRLGKLWQRNYHEHIIRDEQSYQRISEYIINNPAKWAEDKFFTK